MMDAYKISVALAMSSNHAAVLSALSSHLIGVHANVNRLEGGFSRLKTAIGGALAVGAGMTILSTMKELVVKTRDYSDELVKLKNLGGDMGKAVASGDMSKQAFDISRRVPMKVEELLKIPGMTNSILGTEESREHWESLAKLSFVLQNQKDYKGDAGKDLGTLIRAGELSGRFTDKDGKIDNAKFEAFLDTATKIIGATHGMVGPQSLLGLAQQGGGVALRNLSEQGYYSAAIVAQAMGGHRVGTAMLSQWAQMAGGKMSPATAKGMEEFGLLGKDEWKPSRGGGVIVDEAAKQRLTKLIGKDPLDMASHIVDQFKKQGITDPEEQARKVMGMFGRQTTQRLNADQVANFHQMLAERERLGEGYGKAGQFKNFMGESVSANMHSVEDAWHNLLVAVAGPNSLAAIGVMQTLTTRLNGVTEVINRMNPETLIKIAEGLAYLAVTLGGAGIVGMIAALGPAGWIVLGVAAVAGAMHLLSELDWKGIGSSFSAGVDSIKAVLGELGSKVVGALEFGARFAIGAIPEIFAQLGSAIIEALKSVINQVGRGLGIDPAAKGTSPGKTGKPWKENVIPQSFSPGQKTMTAQPIQISMNVDGRSLGQAVSEQLLYLATFSGSAPSADGRSFPTGGDHNFSST